MRANAVLDYVRDVAAHGDRVFAATLLAQALVVQEYDQWRAIELAVDYLNLTDVEIDAVLARWRADNETE